MENSATRNELFIMKLLTQTQEGIITWSKLNENDIRISKIHNISGKSFICTIKNKDIIIYKYEFKSEIFITYKDWTTAIGLKIFNQLDRFPDWSTNSIETKVLTNLYNIVTNLTNNIDTFIDDFIKK
ncbi:hypothetical protein [Butyricimonas virosa]